MYIYKSMLFLTFLNSLFVFTIIIVFFVIFCPSGAVANKIPSLWDSKGILILILILPLTRAWPSDFLYSDQRGSVL